MPRTKSTILYQFDRDTAQGAVGVLVGLDEAGRGPLAGPVVAAAAILDLDDEIVGVNDSKRITALRRPKIYEAITARARAWAVGMCSPVEIDKLNILQASLLAMHRAVEQLRSPWDLALADGNQLIPQLPAARQRTIVGGDGHSASIAAASIIAKVTRDRIMVEYDQRFPAYGFAQHKGYPTSNHIAALREHGLCEIHRRSFCEHLFMQTRLDL